MLMLVHGAAGGWDELAIALIAFAVLWIAIRLAGRAPVEDEADDLAAGTMADDDLPLDAEQPDRAHPTPLG